MTLIRRGIPIPPARPGTPQHKAEQPRDTYGRDNPNVRLYVKCAFCKRITKHTSYHPFVSYAFGTHPVGGFVCRKCSDYLTHFTPSGEPKPCTGCGATPHVRTPQRRDRKTPRANPGTLIRFDVPLPPEVSK